MKFKEAYVILVPEIEPASYFLTVDPAKDRSKIDNDKYTCYTVLVQHQAQALEECKKLAEQEGVNVITLCPGFSHQNIAQICDVVGKNVGICVARGDNHSSKIISEYISQMKQGCL